MIANGGDRRLMTHLRYYTTESLENLRRAVADRLEWYYAPVREVPLTALSGFRESNVEAPELT